MKISDLFTWERDDRATFWSPYDGSVLTYWRSGVGLAKTDSFRLDGGLVLLDQRRRWCQRSRLVSPMLPKSTCSSIQTNTRQLYEHRVAQLKVKGRPPALNWNHRREKEALMNNKNRARAITCRKTWFEDTDFDSIHGNKQIHSDKGSAWRHA